MWSAEPNKQALQFLQKDSMGSFLDGTCIDLVFKSAQIYCAGYTFRLILGRYGHMEG